jgi:Protein of unknown function (DUF1579)
MMRVFVMLFFLLLTLSSVQNEIRAQESLDGPSRIFQDPLLNNLVGEWQLKRQIGGRAAENAVTVEWVLNHQFLRIHMKDVKTPSSYEAMVFVGYDNTSERYVVHWIDVFGGRFSETLGYGSRNGNAIKFVFEYPDGPFHNTFRWNPQTKSWRFLMEQKNRDGKWVTFAEDTLMKR